MIVKLYTWLFHTKAFTVIVACMSIILCLCACEKDINPDSVSNDSTLNDESDLSEDVMIKYFNQSNADKNIYELASVVYSEEELDDIVNEEYHIDALNDKYPVEVIRSGAPYGSEDYSVAYLGKEHYVSMLYGKDGICLGAEKVRISNITLEQFLSIEIGTPLENVKSFDLYGDYDLTEHITGQYIPLTSIHYSKDGYIVYITYYDESYCVEKIEYVLVW